MAHRTARAAYAVLPCILPAFFSTIHATPNAAFPFNSQVPTVARVNEEYNFQLSDSTFAPTSGVITYSLENPPKWLSIDSATRTLLGTPREDDAGSSDFTIVAADSTGDAQMQCTLVIAKDPAPHIAGDIAKQLAATANLSSTQPPTVTLLPSSQFNFDFGQESFIDIVQRKLYYYATLADHTPLPSWLIFDSQTRTFSGTAPELSAFPQSWTIDLIASDVEGFAGTSTSFTIAIGTQQLAFVPEEQDLNVTSGKPVFFTALHKQLFLNGEEVEHSELEHADAEGMPSWLSFDARTLELRGEAPEDVTEKSVTIKVTDKSGNTASVIVNLLPSKASLFKEHIGTVVAQAGYALTYHFEDSLFSEPDLDLHVSLPASATWLNFNSDTRNLEGTVPSSAEATPVQATLTARPPNGEDGQSQAFEIDIKGKQATTSSAATSSMQTSAAPTSSTTATAGLQHATADSEHLSGSLVACIVILSIIGAALVVFCLWWCCKRRRQGRSYVSKKSSPSPSKSSISRPIPAPDGGDNTIVVTTDIHRDVEKEAGAEDEVYQASPCPPQRQLPPQIAMESLNLPPLPAAATNNRKSKKWSKRFSRISHASSLGVGEDAIKADSNIPEWGQQASTLHTPHDSFGPSTRIARMSRPLSGEDGLTSQKTLQRLRERGRRSRTRDSIGLGISSAATGSAGVARHSSKNSCIGKHRRGRSSFGGLSTTREASSMASMSTRGTSLLSTRASEFPLPPLSTTTASMSLSIPTLSVFEATAATEQKRKSIRLVERSDSVQDTRSIGEKRESFIRNRFRASRHDGLSVQSPLFSHGSRVSSSTHTKQNGSQSGTASATGSVRRPRNASRPLNSKNFLTTYSESSSLEPPHQPIEPRRSRRRSNSKRFSARLRAAFPPNYPRAISEQDVAVARTSSSNWTTSESSTSSDGRENWHLMTQMSKPRHERDWRLPTEEPTPPPPSRRPSPSRKPAGSPLSSRMPSHEEEDASRRSRISEPLSLVSADSVSGRALRPAKRRRPGSVDDHVARLSSMQADAVAGGEREDGGTGLRVSPIERRLGTGRSDLSGAAFL